jgi:AAA domain
VIVDPLMAFLSADTNSHRDQDVRKALFRLSMLAEDTGAAVVVVRHLNKSNAGPALYRGGGSIGIIGAARAALLIARDPGDENRRVLAPLKMNLAADPESLVFHIEGTETACRVVWDGTSEHRAGDLLSQPQGEERSERDDAKDFLLDALDGGPVPAQTITRDARAAGIAERTLKRAKKDMAIVSEKAGMDGGWVWRLAPKGATDTRRVPQEKDGPLRPSSGDGGTLREPERTHI